MSRYIAEITRSFVAERANFKCEYCRISDENTFFAFHIDHIISLKHSGSSSTDNLAYSCQICNLNKGSDIATFINDVPEPIRFYNPRTDNWSDHFMITSSGFLQALTQIATATVKILNLNHPDSITERSAMIELGVFE